MYKWIKLYRIQFYERLMLIFSPPGNNRNDKQGTSSILDVKVDSISEDKSKHALVDVSMTD